MTKNILFDMGNVLIRFAPEEFVRRCGAADESDRRRLLREVYQSVEWVELDRGTITEEQALSAMLARLPERLHTAAEKLVTHWDRPLLVVEGMETLARELAGNGYELYLLTNAGPRHREYWFRFPVSDLFPEERICRSSDWKLLKPERDYYEKALSLFSLDRRECLFIDDTPYNVEAAIRCGIPGLVFHGEADQLRRDLRARGVLVGETGE